jgi:hypothetical protein
MSVAFFTIPEREIEGDTIATFRELGPEIGTHPCS